MYSDVYPPSAYQLKQVGFSCSTTCFVDLYSPANVRSLLEFENGAKGRDGETPTVGSISLDWPEQNCVAQKSAAVVQNKFFSFIFSIVSPLLLLRQAKGGRNPQVVNELGDCRQALFSKPFYSGYCP